MKRRLFLTVIAIMTFTIMSCASAFAASKTEVTIKPKTDSRKVTFTVNAPKSVLKKADKYRFEAKMYNGKNVTVTKKGTIDLKKYNKKGRVFTLPYYGKYTVKGYLYKGNKRVETLKDRTLKVKASEYNIVELRTTTPVLITTLKFLGDDSYTTGAKGQSIPTMICLGRDQQYNWDKLPDNWYRDPMEYKATSIAKRIRAMEAYVKMLHEISPSAVFHIYCCDYHLHELAAISYGAGISEDKYTLTMVTDGSASYTWFRNAYTNHNEADAYAQHEKLVSEYLKYRKAAKKGKSYAMAYDNDKSRPFRSYAYAVLDGETKCGVKAEWWVVRKSADTFDIEDVPFQTDVLNDTRISSNYINGLLSKLQASPNEKVFKVLYNFDDSAIKNAIKNGKKPMMILGTSRSVENKNPVAPFIRFTKFFYGDEYAYFYKGHPGYITEDYPERMEEMKNLGLTVLDSSIAAELFQYYNPGLYMSGYTTSTFQNVGDASSDCGLFNIQKEAALSDVVYAKDMDFFMTNIKKVDDDAVYELITNKKHSNFLVEFSDEVIEKTGNEIAIWDDTDGTCRYFYKDGNGNYVER